MKDDSGGIGNVPSLLNGLPMRELISAPLVAAAESQQELASVAWEYFQRIAFYGKDEANSGTNNDGAQAGDTRILKFEVERPVQEGSRTSMVKQTVKQTVKAPFIGLVLMLIDRVDVDFQMEVTDTATSSEKTSTDLSSNISSNWFVKASITGKVSSARENTRTTNQTAKYQVHVSASQQPQTEGCPS